MSALAAWPWSILFYPTKGRGDDSMKKTLIVNADDCNLTAGVTRSILETHETGIVTSTTFLINLPIDSRGIKNLLRSKRLGIGLHLNVTLGEPVSRLKAIPSLVNEKGEFLRPENYLRFFPSTQEVLSEYRSQIALFKKVFRRFPTHLDTHHQLHDRPFFYALACETARSFKLPLRRSRLMRKKSLDLKTTDYLWGDLEARRHWTKSKLERMLRVLPDGLSELMCHPGKNDAQLQQISSFTKGRAEEAKVFGSSQAKRLIERCGITLSHYGLCYTR